MFRSCYYTSFKYNANDHLWINGSILYLWGTFRPIFLGRYIWFKDISTLQQDYSRNYCTRRGHIKATKVPSFPEFWWPFVSPSGNHACNKAKFNSVVWVLAPSCWNHSLSILEQPKVSYYKAINLWIDGQIALNLISQMKFKNFFSFQISLSSSCKLAINNPINGF